MFAAKNLLLSRRSTAIATATSSTNVTVTPASFSGYVAGNSDLTYVIPSCVVIGSTTIASYALTFSGFNARDKIFINNSGKIVGRGGDGNGGAGGPALNVSGSGAPVIINNLSGAIIGSGGGAGGGGVSAYTCIQSGPCCTPTGSRAYAAGGGAGGGQGYTGGSGGPVVGTTSNMTTSGGGHFASAGSAGTVTTYGNGGCPTFAFASYTGPLTYFGAGGGGNGGSFGSNGSAGSNNVNQTPAGWPYGRCIPFGAGGTTGNAIKGVGVFTLNNSGNVYGPQIP